VVRRRIRGKIPTFGPTKKKKKKKKKWPQRPPGSVRRSFPTARRSHRKMHMFGRGLRTRLPGPGFAESWFLAMRQSLVTPEIPPRRGRSGPVFRALPGSGWPSALTALELSLADQSCKRVSPPPSDRILLGVTHESLCTVWWKVAVCCVSEQVFLFAPLASSPGSASPIAGCFIHPGRTPKTIFRFDPGIDVRGSGRFPRRHPSPAQMRPGLKPEIIRRDIARPFAAREQKPEIPSSHGLGHARDPRASSRKRLCRSVFFDGAQQ